MNDIIVSIVMATYNGGQYLREQLDSIFAQTQNDFEVIVGDDGSIDGTIDILGSYGDRVRVIHNKCRLGFVRSFENLLRQVQGKFVALSDQDDIWFPQKIQRLYDTIGDALLVHSDAVLIDGSGNRLGKSLTEYTGKKCLARDRYDVLFENPVTGCTTFFRRDLLRWALPFPDGIPYHDWWLAYVAASRGTITYCPEPLLAYRQHELNSSGITRASLLNRIGDVIRKGFFSSRRKRDFLHNARFYRAVRTVKEAEISRRERAVLNDLEEYYDSYASNRIRFRAFAIYIRRFSRLCPRGKFHVGFLRLLLSLLGG